MTTKPYEFTLFLDDLQYLFQKPLFDPLHGRFDDLSGVEQILDVLKPLSLQRPLRATISLPPEKTGADTARVASAAVRGYSDGQIRRLDREMAALRWNGFKALQTGLLFLAACLLLSAFFGNLSALPEFLSTFLSEGFLIAGWVSLWHPTEILLYEWWPIWREKQLYKRIRDMEIIVADEPTR